MIFAAHGFDWDALAVPTPYTLLEAKRAIEESEKRLFAFREPGSFEHYIRERAIARERASNNKSVRSQACWRSPEKRAFAQAHATKLHAQGVFVYRGKYDEPAKARCRALYLAGEPFSVISAKCGMSRRTISHICQGLNRRTRATITEQTIAAMRALREQGLTVARIGHILGCSAMVVSRRLRGLK